MEIRHGQNYELLSCGILFQGKILITIDGRDVCTDSTKIVFVLLSYVLNSTIDMLLWVIGVVHISQYMSMLFTCSTIDCQPNATLFIHCIFANTPLLAVLEKYSVKQFGRWRSGEMAVRDSVCTPVMYL